MIAMGLEKIPQINDCDEWEDMTYLKWFYEREQPMPTALAWHRLHAALMTGNSHKFSRISKLA